MCEHACRVAGVVANSSGGCLTKGLARCGGICRLCLTIVYPNRRGCKAGICIIELATASITHGREGEREHLGPRSPTLLKPVSAPCSRGWCSQLAAMEDYCRMPANTRYAHSPSFAAGQEANYFVPTVLCQILSDFSPPLTSILSQLRSRSHATVHGGSC